MKTRDMQELLNTQTNAEKTNTPNSELVSRETIHGTPFNLVGNEDKGWFLAMANYRITEMCDTKSEALEKLDSDTWSIMLAMVHVAMEIHKQMEDNDKLADWEKQLTEQNRE